MRLQHFTQPLGGMPGKTAGGAAPCRVWASCHIVARSVGGLRFGLGDGCNKSATGQYVVLSPRQLVVFTPRILRVDEIFNLVQEPVQTPAAQLGMGV